MSMRCFAVAQAPLLSAVAIPFPACERGDALLCQSRHQHGKTSVLQRFCANVMTQRRSDMQQIRRVIDAVRDFADDLCLIFGAFAKVHQYRRAGLSAGTE